MARKAVLVTGLGAGDEGKGSIVDAIVRREGAGLVVRHNGGCQAAHHVVTDDGREHCFSQFGAGTLAGAATYLSRRMLFDPFALEREADHLEQIGVKFPETLLTIDREAVVVTPMHAALNHARESARMNPHGSCGRGIGEAASFAARVPRFALRVRDLQHEGVSYQKLRAYIDLVRDDWRSLGARKFAEMPAGFEGLTDRAFENGMAEQLAFAYQTWWRDWYACVGDERCVADAVERGSVVVFEGAQGVLLDEWCGFSPHTTWSTTTDANALALLRGINYTGEIVRVGVLRSFATRHGAGPLPTEHGPLGGSEIVDMTGEHNIGNAWQGPFRTGYFDCDLARYAIRVNGGVDCLALTWVDRITPAWKFAATHGIPLDPPTTRDDAALAHTERLGDELRGALETVFGWADGPRRFIDAVEAQLGKPVGIISRGRCSSDKEFRPAYENHTLNTFNSTQID